MSTTAIYTPFNENKRIWGWLAVFEGLDAWRDIRIPEDDTQFFLGRGDDCRFKLSDELLDNLHASVRMAAGSLTITDLDTSIGTFVNGEPITKVELHDGDVIKMGKTSIKFRKL